MIWNKAQAAADNLRSVPEIPVTIETVYFQASKGVGLEPVGTGTKPFPPGPNPGETPPKGSGWWPSSHRPIDQGRKARPYRSLYCKAALGTPH